MPLGNLEVEDVVVQFLDFHQVPLELAFKLVQAGSPLTTASTSENGQLLV